MPRKTKLVEPDQYEAIKGGGATGMAGAAAGSIPVTSTTPAAKIERWQTLKAHLATQSKAFAEFCAPFRTEQEAIESWLLNFLNETGQNSAKTDAGTAYKSTLTQPKITDRTAYLDWCLDQWEAGGNEMLQISAPQVSAFETYMEERKKAIQAHADQNGGELPPDASLTPPGTDVGFFTRLNIRKS